MSTTQPERPSTVVVLTAAALRTIQKDAKARRNRDSGWLRTLLQTEHLPLLTRVERLVDLAQHHPEWRTADADTLAFAVAVQDALQHRKLTWLPNLRPTGSDHWRPAAIRGEWMRPDTPSYLGWVMDTYRWNGWVVPRFPAAEARRIVADNEQARRTPTAGEPDDELRIVSDRPQLIVELHRPAYATDADYEPEHYVEDVDGSVAIGAMIWTWQEDIESAAAAHMRLRDIDPINDRRSAARFLRRSAQVSQGRLDLTAPGANQVDAHGVSLFGAYDAELFDARRGEALSVFSAAGEDALTYVATVTPVQNDDTVYVPSATYEQRVQLVLMHLQVRDWRAVRGHEPADIDVTLPSGHTVGFAIGDPGTWHLAGLFAPDGTPIDTPEVADILGAYQPAAHTSRAFARETAERILRALIDLRDLLGDAR